MQPVADLFDMYRRLFFTDGNGEIVWWYCGVVFSEIEGVGNIPISQAETIMLYRTEIISPDCFKVYWREVGYFRDLATGEILQSWFNPYTGQTVAKAQGLEDGPAYYTVTRSNDAAGMNITLTQAHAKVHAVSLKTTTHNGRISFVQTEDKTRVYQRPDESWPDLDSPEASTIQTVLSIFGNVADGADGASPATAPGVGYYTSGPVGRGSGAWQGTVVHGVMKRAAVDEKLNPLAWERLNKMYPYFFKAGRVNPGWD